MNTIAAKVTEQLNSVGIEAYHEYPGWINIPDAPYNWACGTENEFWDCDLVESHGDHIGVIRLIYRSDHQSNGVDIAFAIAKMLQDKGRFFKAKYSSPIKVKDNTTMNTDYCNKHLADAGFHLPPMTHIKTDPRGKEYGFHEAIGEGEGVKVKKTPGNPEERAPYTMIFPTMKDFREWASDCS